MKINIRTLNGSNPVSVEIEDSKKVEDLKKKIEEVLHIQPNNQKLIFRGQVLQDSKVLLEAGLFDECAVHPNQPPPSNDSTSESESPSGGVHGSVEVRNIPIVVGINAEDGEVPDVNLDEIVNNVLSSLNIEPDGSTRTVIAHTNGNPINFTHSSNINVRTIGGNNNNNNNPTSSSSSSSSPSPPALHEPPPPLPNNTTNTASTANTASTNNTNNTSNTTNTSNSSSTSSSSSGIGNSIIHSSSININNNDYTNISNSLHTTENNINRLIQNLQLNDNNNNNNSQNSGNELLYKLCNELILIISEIIPVLYKLSSMLLSQSNINNNNILTNDILNLVNDSLTGISNTSREISQLLNQSNNNNNNNRNNRSRNIISIVGPISSSIHSLSEILNNSINNSNSNTNSSSSNTNNNNNNNNSS